MAVVPRGLFISVFETGSLTGTWGFQFRLSWPSSPRESACLHHLSAETASMYHLHTGLFHMGTEHGSQVLILLTKPSP